MISFFYLFLAIFGGTLHFLFSKNKTRIRAVEIYLLYFIIFCIGISGLAGAYFHTFLAAQTAEKIGWAPGSPFQFEVAMANLAVGVAGVLCIWFRGYFWLATVIIASIFIYGAAYGHFVQIAKGDLAPYNSGVFLYLNDIGIPMVYDLLAIIYFSKKPK